MTYLDERNKAAAAFLNIAYPTDDGFREGADWGIFESTVVKNIIDAAKKERAMTWELRVAISAWEVAKNSR